jgi:phosphoglycolate phosphatase-like HAD superfamily hydrolase
MMDIGAAKAAGLPSVAVFTGPFKGERLLQTEPDYLLDSINDLPSLLVYLEKQA